MPYWKVKGSSRKMRQLTDGVRTLEPKEKRAKKVESRQNGDDNVTYANVNEKSSKFRGRGERDLKTRGGNMGFEAVIDGKSDRKSKRVYADAGAVDKGPYEETSYRKSVSKAQRNTVEPYPDKVKNMSRHKPHDLESSGKNESNAGNVQFKGTERRDRKNARDKLVGKPRHVRESRLGNRIMKKSDRRRTLLPTETDMNQRKFAIDYAERPRRNNVRGMKSVATASELTEDLPKKKKRVIRIDPYDISNKRMDDGISNNGNSEGNKELAETSEVEMSKNAQFRAIIPSSSILSFVDDNLLGRRRDIDFRRAGYNIELPAPLDNIPFSTSSERERIEVPIFRNKLEFFAAAKISSSFPSPELPEIAFAGRSNVGKSSLLNALTRQWGVVRTSDKPGLTQTINFFKLGPKLSLVDLPGYGFAYAKDEVKEAWEELVKEYVASRESLKRVCLLVDTKWGLKPRDHELIDLMERSQTNYQIVLTKTDTVFPIDVARRAMQIEESLKAKKSAVQPLMMVSSKTAAGIRSLRTALANILRFAKR